MHEPVVISKHKTRRAARRQALRVAEAVEFWQTAGIDARERYYASSMARLGLTTRLPRWAASFRAERAKRTPFAWCVRAYPAQSAKPVFDHQGTQADRPDERPPYLGHD